MTVSNLTDKLIKFFSWLYFRPWERWELLIIVLICLVLLLLIVWQQRKSTTKSVYVNQVRERSPIIGVKLADNRSHLRIEDLKQDHSAHVSKKHAKKIKTKAQLEKLNQQVQQLQYEINKHKQTEEHLKRQVIELTTELTTANEQLRQNTVVSNHIEQKAKQQILEVPAVKEQPSHEPAESSTVKQKAKQQAGESKAAKKSFNRRTNIRKQPDRNIRKKTEKVKLSKELKEQPLDVERLKAIADLAKRIQNRPLKRS
jgi:chromosome segregation ATPase